jgi:hypothetical protein
MDYRNIKRISLAHMALQKFKFTDQLSLFDIQILYALYYLTRYKPTSTIPMIRQLYKTKNGYTMSTSRILTHLCAMEEMNLVTHTKQKAIYQPFLWSLTLAGHNAMKQIERLLRLERFDHKITPTKINFRPSASTQQYDHQSI